MSTLENKMIRLPDGNLVRAGLVTAIRALPPDVCRNLRDRIVIECGEKGWTCVVEYANSDDAVAARERLYSQIERNDESNARHDGTINI